MNNDINSSLNQHSWQETLPAELVTKRASDSPPPSPRSVEFSKESDVRISRLEKLHADGPTLLERIAFVVSYVFNKFVTSIKGFDKDHDLILLAQENLSVKGSLDAIHKQLFLDLLRNKEGANFDKLRSGIAKMETMDEPSLKNLICGEHKRYANELIRTFNSLQENEEMWINLTTRPGQHAMKGCIIRQQDGYVFRMSNTGAGLDVNDDLHPQINILNKVLYQTVVEWGPMSEEIFSDQFFKDIVGATLFGKLPEGEGFTKTEIKPELQGDIVENLENIQVVYDTLKGHFREQPLVDPLKDYKNATPEELHRAVEKSPYWSRAQVGPSCAPNSIWALARVVLKPEELQELRTDAKVKNLLRNYTKIKHGFGGTAAKIAALEQVKAIIEDIENQGLAAPKVFLDIQEKIKSPEAGAGVPLKDRKVAEIKDNQILLRKADFKKVIGEFQARVSYQNYEVDGQTFHIHIKHDVNGHPQGLPTLAVLLYEQLLAGDKDGVEVAMDAFIQQLNPEQKMLPEDFEVENPMELYHLAQAFLDLASKIRDFDETAEARSKQLVLVNIAKSLATVFFTQSDDEKSKVALYNDVKSHEEVAIEFHTHFEVKDAGWEAKNRAVRRVDFDMNWRGEYQNAAFLADAARPLRDQMGRPLNYQFDKEHRAPKIDTQKQPITLAVGRYSFRRQKQDLFFSWQIPEIAPGKPIKLMHSQMELIQREDGKITGKSLVDKLHLFYHYLGSNEKGELKSLIEEIRVGLKDLNKQDKEKYIEIVSMLTDYCRDMMRKDLSPNSFLLQHTVALLAGAIINKVGIQKESERNIALKVHDLISFYDRANSQAYAKETAIAQSLFNEVKKLK